MSLAALRSGHGKRRSHVQEWNLDDTDFEGLICRYISTKETSKVSRLKAVSKNVVTQLLISLAVREINLCCSERILINSHSILQQSTRPLRKARMLQEALTQLHLKSVSHEGCLTEVSHKTIPESIILGEGRKTTKDLTVEKTCIGKLALL